MTASGPQQTSHARSPGPVDLTGLMNFAHALADRSALVTLPHFRQRIDVDNKAGRSGFDPVTVADRDAERAISGLIRERHPGHGLVGEEFGDINPGASLTWVVDPVDGTRAFIMGTPLWGTLIGLMSEGAPVLGLMDQPFTRERFWAAGGRAFSRTSGGDEREIKTRSCPALRDAILTTTDPRLFTAGHESKAYRRLEGLVRMSRYGGDCYAYCLLASGFVDLVVETGLKSYDVVALIPIVEAAGGRMTTWDGKPATAGGRIIAAGDPRLHEDAMNVLAKP